MSVSISRHPIRDMDIPSPKRLREILDEIDAALAARRSVYLHCRAGIGRTGTVVGCYLIRHGLATRETVFDRIAELRKETPTAAIPSPEAESQRMVIKSWRPRTPPD
jgi:protein-tyrosine phosphatase